MKSEKIKTAEQIAKKFEKNKVIILMIDEETLQYASYGSTKMLCTDAKKLADIAYKAVYEYLENR